MDKVKLGRTDLEISTICFGTAAISGEGGGYGFGNISESDSLNLMDFTFDSGINFYDTAPIYGYDLAELRLGKFLKRQRDKKIVVSKCGIGWHYNKRVNHSNDPDFCIKMLEKSLRSLNTDYIDIYLVHAPHEKESLSPLMEALQIEKKKGKIRFLGVSNFNAKQLTDISEIDVIQNEFNLFTKMDEELINKIQSENLGAMSWGTFDKGILTDRVTIGRSYEKVDLRSWAPWWKKQNLEKKLKKLEAIKNFSDKIEIDLLSLCLNFNISQKFLHSTICGGRNKQQWEEILNYQRREVNFEELLEDLK